MADLITVPCFNFEQGDPYGEERSERPIQVKYYNGSMCLEQAGNEIIILPEYFEKLVKEIRKHMPEANRRWK